MMNRGYQKGDSNCSICYKPFSDTKLPMLLKCYHGFCKPCIDDILGYKCEAKCPFCNETFKFDGLIPCDKSNLKILILYMQDEKSRLEDRLKKYLSKIEPSVESLIEMKEQIIRLLNRKIDRTSDYNTGSILSGVNKTLFTLLCFTPFAVAGLAGLGLSAVLDIGSSLSNSNIQTDVLKRISEISKKHDEILSSELFKDYQRNFIRCETVTQIISELVRFSNEMQNDFVKNSNFSFGKKISNSITPGLLIGQTIYKLVQTAASSTAPVSESLAVGAQIQSELAVCTGVEAGGVATNSSLQSGSQLTSTAKNVCNASKVLLIGGLVVSWGVTIYELVDSSDKEKECEKIIKNNENEIKYLKTMVNKVKDL